MSVNRPEDSAWSTVNQACLRQVGRVVRLWCQRVLRIGVISQITFPRLEWLDEVLVELKDCNTAAFSTKGYVQNPMERPILQDAVGYHYEGIEDTDGCVSPGTRTDPDRNGVYEGNVAVGGIRKKLRSTFFPREWSPWQVAHAIKEAYENRKLIVGNKYRGESQWFPVEFYLDAQEKIKTAYPIKENE